MTDPLAYLDPIGRASSSGAAKRGEQVEGDCPHHQRRPPIHEHDGSGRCDDDDDDVVVDVDVDDGDVLILLC